MAISLISDKDERAARVAWSLIAEPGDLDATAVIADLGFVDALEAVQDPRRAAELAQHSAGRAAAVARWSSRLPQGCAATALRAAERDGVHLVDPLSVPGISDLDDTVPYLLWVHGDVQALEGEGALGWAGARASSAYGEHATDAIVSDLAMSGTTVHTGGAYGIDAAATRASLSVGGRSVVWLACGLDRAYPTGHSDLFRGVAGTEGCALVSELPLGATPTAYRFLSRNRLIAAATRATVIAEAGLRSGAINTAVQAQRLGRGLGAIPGPITSTTSSGCHVLLRDHGARLVAGVDDVRDLLTLSSVAQLVDA